jgi:hypothetical protein
VSEQLIDAEKIRKAIAMLDELEGAIDGSGVDAALKIYAEIEAAEQYRSGLIEEARVELHNLVLAGRLASQREEQLRKSLDRAGNDGERLEAIKAYRKVSGRDLDTIEYLLLEKGADTVICSIVLGVSKQTIAQKAFALGLECDRSGGKWGRWRRKN